MQLGPKSKVQTRLYKTAGVSYLYSFSWLALCLWRLLKFYLVLW